MHVHTRVHVSSVHPACTVYAKNRPLPQLLAHLHVQGLVDVAADDRRLAGRGVLKGAQPEVIRVI